MTFSPWLGGLLATRLGLGGGLGGDGGGATAATDVRSRACFPSAHSLSHSPELGGDGHSEEP